MTRINAFLAKKYKDRKTERQRDRTTETMTRLFSDRRLSDRHLSDCPTMTFVRPQDTSTFVQPKAKIATFVRPVYKQDICPTWTFVRPDICPTSVEKATFVRPDICPTQNLSNLTLKCVSIFQFVHPSVCPFVCLSVSLSFWPSF